MALITYLEEERKLEDRIAQIDSLIRDNLYEIDECQLTPEEKERKEAYINRLRDEVADNKKRLTKVRLNIRRDLGYLIFGDGITFNPNKKED
jgi:hypothetical protein